MANKVFFIRGSAEGVWYGRVHVQGALKLIGSQLQEINDAEIHSFQHHLFLVAITLDGELKCTWDHENRDKRCS